jgi:hypothetical protein
LASGSNVRIIVGAAAAIVIEFTMAVPSLRGISTWKYALAALGLVLFVWGSVEKT